MKKDDITTLAQLLSGMKDAIDKLERAQKQKSIDDINAAKVAIIAFQKEIAKIL